MSHCTCMCIAHMSVQCLRVDVLLPAVYCGFGRCGSQGFVWWHYDVAV